MAYVLLGPNVIVLVHGSTWDFKRRWVSKYLPNGDVALRAASRRFFPDPCIAFWPQSRVKQSGSLEMPTTVRLSKGPKGGLE